MSGSVLMGGVEGGEGGGRCAWSARCGGCGLELGWTRLTCGVRVCACAMMQQLSEPCVLACGFKPAKWRHCESAERDSRTWKAFQHYSANSDEVWTDRKSVV